VGGLLPQPMQLLQSTEADCHTTPGGCLGPARLGHPLGLSPGPVEEIAGLLD